MSSFETRVAARAHHIELRNFGGWQVEQISPPSSGSASSDIPPHRSRGLLLWLDRLSDRPGPRAYRVAPACEIE